METEQVDEDSFKRIEEKRKEGSELLEELKSFDDIFSRRMIEYLQSLIGLEISALEKSFLDEDKMNLLNSLDLYRKIVAYNIFNRSCKMCRKNTPYLIITEKSNPKILRVQGLCKGYIYDVFDFHSTEDNFSTINLYEIENNEKKRKSVIKSLHMKLNLIENNERLLNEIGSNQTWKTDLLKEKIEELEQRNNLYVDGNLYRATIQRQFSKSILENYGLSEDDFSITNPSNDDMSLHKKLIKQYPHTMVVRNINYY